MFIGITAYFLLMNFLGHGNSFYLRLVNLFFVFYGVNRTIKMNVDAGQKDFVSNAVSAMVTPLSACF